MTTNYTPSPSLFDPLVLDTLSSEPPEPAQKQQADDDPFGVLKEFKAQKSPAPANYEQMIRDEAIRQGVDPEFMLKIYKAEGSRGNPRARSPKGALGLLQIVPETGRKWGASVNQLFDPATNIRIGVSEARERLKQNGSKALGAAAYNAGQKAVDQYGGVPPYPETRAYVANTNNATQDDPFGVLAEFHKGTPAAPTPEQPGQRVINPTLNIGKMAPDVQVNAGTPAVPRSVYTKIPTSLRIDVREDIADLDAGEITPEQFKQRAQDKYATALGFEPWQIPVARQWGEAQKAGYDPFALEMNDPAQLAAIAKANGGTVRIGVSTQNAKILEGLRNDPLLNPSLAQAESAARRAPRQVMGLEKVMRATPGVGAAMAVADQLGLSSDIQSAATSVGANALQTVYNLWKLSGGEKPVESDLSRRLLEQAQAEAAQSPGAVHDIARGLLQGLFATPEYLAAATGGPLGFAALGGAEQAHRGTAQATKAALINAIIGAALHGGAELPTGIRVPYSAGVGAAPSALEAATQGATPGQAALAAVPGAVQMGLLGVVGGKKRGGSDEAWLGPAVTPEVAQRAREIAAQRIIASSAAGNLTTQGDIEAIRQSSLADALTEARGGKNATQTGQEQAGNEAELRGVRTGENVPAHEGEVRQGAGEQATGRGGAERGTEVGKKEVAGPTLQEYTDQAVENLKRTSRAIMGEGTSAAAQPGKEALFENISPEEASKLAEKNVRSATEFSYENRDRQFTSPQDFLDFADDIARINNQGILKADTPVVRALDSEKYPYTPAADLPKAREQFAKELIERLNDPNADPRETAAWIEWRANYTDHFWSDATGRTSRALAEWVLMRNGEKLPKAVPMPKVVVETRRAGESGESYLGPDWEKFRDAYMKGFEEGPKTAEVAPEQEGKYKPPTRTVEDLPIESIITNQTVNRGQAYLEGLARSGKANEPIEVARNANGELLLINGHHRLELARQQGQRTIKAEVFTLHNRVAPEAAPVPVPTTPVSQRSVVEKTLAGTPLTAEEKAVTDYIERQNANQPQPVPEPLQGNAAPGTKEVTPAAAQGQVPEAAGEAKAAPQEQIEPGSLRDTIKQQANAARARLAAKRAAGKGIPGFIASEEGTLRLFGRKGQPPRVPEKTSAVSEPYKRENRPEMLDIIRRLREGGIEPYEGLSTDVERVLEDTRARLQAALRETERETGRDLGEISHLTRHYAEHVLLEDPKEVESIRKVLGDKAYLADEFIQAQRVKKALTYVLFDDMPAQKVWLDEGAGEKRIGEPESVVQPFTPGEVPPNWFDETTRTWHTSEPSAVRPFAPGEAPQPTVIGAQAERGNLSPLAQQLRQGVSIEDWHQRYAETMRGLDTTLQELQSAMERTGKFNSHEVDMVEQFGSGKAISPAWQRGLRGLENKIRTKLPKDDVDLLNQYLLLRRRETALLAEVTEPGREAQIRSAVLSDVERHGETMGAAARTGRQIAEFLKSEKGELTVPKPVVEGLEDFYDYMLVGIDNLISISEKITDTAARMKAWSDSMVSEFGEWIRPHLPDLYRAASGRLTSMQRGDVTVEAYPVRAATVGGVKRSVVQGLHDTLIKNVRAHTGEGELLARERQLARDVLAKPQFYIDEYRMKFNDNIIDSDRVKTIFGLYRSDPARWAETTHEASSFIAKLDFHQRLQQLADKGIESPRIEFRAGGPGSGKTTSLEVRRKKGVPPADLVYDSLFSTVEGNRAAINAVFDARPNATIQVNYVHRPVRLAAKGVLERAVPNEEGTHRRPTPVERTGRGHFRAQNAFFETYEEFKDDPRITFNVMDNSGELHEIKPADVELLGRNRYNSVDEAINEARRGTEERYQAGGIPAEVYQAVTGQRAPGTVEGTPEGKRRVNVEGVPTGSAEAGNAGVQETPAPAAPEVPGPLAEVPAEVIRYTRHPAERLYPGGFSGITGTRRRGNLTAPYRTIYTTIDKTPTAPRYYGSNEVVLQPPSDARLLDATQPNRFNELLAKNEEEGLAAIKDAGYDGYKFIDKQTKAPSIAWFYPERMTAKGVEEGYYHPGTTTTEPAHSLAEARKPENWGKYNLILTPIAKENDVAIHRLDFVSGSPRPSIGWWENAYDTVMRTVLTGAREKVEYVIAKAAQLANQNATIFWKKNPEGPDRVTHIQLPQMSEKQTNILTETLKKHGIDGGTLGHRELIIADMGNEKFDSLMQAMEDFHKETGLKTYLGVSYNADVTLLDREAYTKVINDYEAKSNTRNVTRGAEAGTGATGEGAPLPSRAPPRETVPRPSGAAPTGEAVPVAPAATPAGEPTRAEGVAQPPVSEPAAAIETRLRKGLHAQFGGWTQVRKNGDGTLTVKDENGKLHRIKDPNGPSGNQQATFIRQPAGPTTAESKLKERSLPKTLTASGLEPGNDLYYWSETLAHGVQLGRENVKQKGVRGAIQYVLNSAEPGIDWAPTAYATMDHLRNAEMAARQKGDIEKADALLAERTTFVGDFAERATRLGQTIAGIRAIEEFAPDQAITQLNRMSQKTLGRALTAKEIARAEKKAMNLKIGNDLARQAAQTVKMNYAEFQRSQPAPEVRPRTYREVLDDQSRTALIALKKKTAFDFGNLERPAERGAITIDIPPLPGDAELLAQYAAGRMSKVKTVADLNKEITDLAPAAEPFLPAIRRRAYAIREEARTNEIATATTERKQSVVQEIQAEVAQARREQAEADAAVLAKKREDRKSFIAEAKTQAKDYRAQTEAELKAIATEARERYRAVRQEYKAATQAQKAAYRADIKAQIAGERQAKLWDTPLRREAAAARERLKTATNPAAPETVNDLVSVASELMLPNEPGGAVRRGPRGPERIYGDLRAAFPNLVTGKNRSEIFKRAFERIQDTTAAAREAARLASASREARAYWENAGVDIDQQAILIQRSEAFRRQVEARSAMMQEFARVSRSRLSRILSEVQAIPRSLMSSVDAPIGRQGLFYTITHPIESSRAVIPATFRGYTAWTPEQFENAVRDLQQHPDYHLFRQAGGDWTVASTSTYMGDTGISSGEIGARLAAEEPFQSSIATKLFPHVRLSDQGFNLPMNAQRLTLFSRYADLGRMEGYTWESNPEFFKQAAQWVNIATGRGSLSTKLQVLSSNMNWLFFSTRLNFSRVQLLNRLLLTPIGVMKADPLMRKIIAGEAVRLAAGMGVIYLTAKAAGLNPTFNPHDPDFMKLRVGNTRYDPTGGEASLIRFIVRLVQSAGNDEGIPSENWDNIIETYVRQKMAPWPGAAINLRVPATVGKLARGDVEGAKSTFGTGTTVVGTESNLKFIPPTSIHNIHEMTEHNEAVRMMIPMIIGDLMDNLAEEGWKGAAKTAPGFTGLSVQTYKPTPESERAARIREAAKQRQAALDALRKNPSDTKILDEAVKKGEMTEEQRDRLIKAARLSPTAQKFLSRPDIESKLIYFRKATPEQRKEIWPLLQRAWASAAGEPLLSEKTGKYEQHKAILPPVEIDRLKREYAPELRAAP